MSQHLQFIELPSQKIEEFLKLDENVIFLDGEFNGQKYQMKYYNLKKSENMWEQFEKILKEIFYHMILRQAKAKNIQKIKPIVFLQKNLSGMVLTFEHTFCSLQNLFDEIKTWSYVQILQMAEDVLNAFYELYLQGILLKNIKYNQIVFTKRNVWCIREIQESNLIERQKVNYYKIMSNQKSEQNYENFYKVNFLKEMIKLKQLIISLCQGSNQTDIQNNFLDQFSSMIDISQYFRQRNSINGNYFNKVKQKNTSLPKLGMASENNILEELFKKKINKFKNFSLRFQNQYLINFLINDEKTQISKKQIGQLSNQFEKIEDNIFIYKQLRLFQFNKNTKTLIYQMLLFKKIIQNILSILIQKDVYFQTSSEIIQSIQYLYLMNPKLLYFEDIKRFGSIILKREKISISYFQALLSLDLQSREKLKFHLQLILLRGIDILQKEQQAANTLYRYFSKDNLLFQKI